MLNVEVWFNEENKQRTLVADTDVKDALGRFDKQVLAADDASRLLEDHTRYASDDLRRNTYHPFGTDRLALGVYTKVLPSLPRFVLTHSLTMYWVWHILSAM